MKKQRLKDVVGKRMLFESYPINFIGNNIIDNERDAAVTLYQIVKNLQSFDVDNEKLSEFFDIVDKEDFRDIVMFLSNKLCHLKDGHNL